MVDRYDVIEAFEIAMLRGLEETVVALRAELSEVKQDRDQWIDALRMKEDECEVLQRKLQELKGMGVDTDAD